jgi:nucleotide-binding universal stress UspA family protein
LRENEMSLFPRSILLATDGSEETELAARVAVELAKSTGSELHVVHVKLIPITPPYPEVLDWREDLERAEREARELLDEQVKKVEEAGGTVAGVHLREEGPPAEEIIALAEELEADLIVVGSRDRGRIRRALTESVSDRVIRRARCPVLVVGAGARVAGGAGGGFGRISGDTLSAEALHNPYRHGYKPQTRARDNRERARWGSTISTMVRAEGNRARPHEEHKRRSAT